MNINKDIVEVLDGVLERITDIHNIFANYYLQKEKFPEFAEANHKLAESYIAVVCAINILEKNEEAKE